jgi:hypothetical protein
MNRISLASATVALIGGAGLLAAVAPNGEASSVADSHKLTFTVHTLASKQVGRNLLIETDKATKDGKVIGYSANTCAFDFGAGVAHCDVTLARPSGQVRAKVTVHADTNTSKGRIVGGTGAYAGARGTVSGGPGSRPGTQSITLRWTR